LLRVFLKKHSSIRNTPKQEDLNMKSLFLSSMHRRLAEIASLSVPLVKQNAD
jgi:hypothetical protein